MSFESAKKGLTASDEIVNRSNMPNVVLSYLSYSKSHLLLQK